MNVKRRESREGQARTAVCHTLSITPLENANRLEAHLYSRSFASIRGLIFLSVVQGLISGLDEKIQSCPNARASKKVPGKLTD